MTFESRDPARAFAAPWRALWQAAERLTLLTALAFVASTLVNVMVFDTWGLTFLAVATPSDVLMSGLILGLVPAITWTGYTACYALVVARKSKWTRWLAYFGAVGAICTIVPRFVGYGPPAGQLWWLSFTLGFVLAGAVLASDRWAIGSEIVGWRERVAAIGRRFVRDGLRILLLVAFLFFSGAMVWVVSEAGYLASPMRFSEKDKGKYCDGRVVWIGERALIIDCGVAPIHDYQLLYGLEGVTLVQDRRHYASPSPPPMAVDFLKWLREISA